MEFIGAAVGIVLLYYAAKALHGHFHREDDSWKEEKEKNNFWSENFWSKHR